MDYIKIFLRDESGSAEAASSAVLIAMASGLSAIWNGGLDGICNGICNSVIDNPLALILVGFTLIFVMWMVYKA